MRHLSSLFSRNEQGQSAIIIAGALVVLVAAIALVVDGGNAYAQRRQLQNALDAGAQAGAIQMTLVKTNGQIDDAIRDFVRRNGVDPSLVNAYFVTQDADGNRFVERDMTIISYGANSYPPPEIQQRQVFGLALEGVKVFPTFFAGVIGWREMQVGTESMRPAPTVKGPPTGTCQAEDLFPLTVSVDTFGNDPIHFLDTEPTYSYRIKEQRTGLSQDYGRFGYVTWNGDTSSGQLVTYMNNVTLSSRWSVNDEPANSSANMSNNNVWNALRGYWTSQTPISVPVYDLVNGTDSNGDGVLETISNYPVIGFARMTIIGGSAFGTAVGDRYLDVRFQRFVEPTGGGGCPYYGDGTIQPPTSDNLSRQLVGTVKLSKISPVGETTQEEVHVPVDVVNVMDISGSMTANFGGMTKLQAAKTALRNFNDNMQPGLGDKVGLATFPRLYTSTRYNYNCSQSGSTTTYYVAQERHALTSNIAAVNSTINSLSANGGTPIAAGMQQGRLTALGAGHGADKPAIIILASDGLANIRLNGKWTGFDGNANNGPACNDPAEDDALAEANTAKADVNLDGEPDTIVFTIAVGDNFNPDLLQAMASVDTDPSKPHYFRVTDATSMNNIYQQIASRVQNIQNESCDVIQTEAFAGPATLTVRNQSTGQQYTVTTTSTGEFVINDVEPGTFEFTSGTSTEDGFTYDIFTDGVGGPPLGSNPTVVVGQGAGTYKTDLFLKTNDEISCPGS